MSMSIMGVRSIIDIDITNRCKIEEEGEKFDEFQTAPTLRHALSRKYVCVCMSIWEIDAFTYCTSDQGRSGISSPDKATRDKYPTQVEVLRRLSLYLLYMPAIIRIPMTQLRLLLLPL